MRIGVVIVVSLLCIFPAVPFFAAPLLPEAMEKLREEGFRRQYNLDFPQAQLAFEKMTWNFPDHPAGYIYLGGSLWLERITELRRLQTQLYSRDDSFFLQRREPPDTALEKRVTDLLQKGIALAEKMKARNDDDQAALYYLGSAYGSLAGYQATVKRSFMTALKEGKRAVEFHKRLLRKNPEFVDAQLTVGLYNYVVGTLPLGVKILMFLGAGAHGSRKDGLELLEKVYAHGKFAKEEAAAMLAVVYQREKRPSDSLKMMQALSASYPGNAVFKLEVATLLATSSRWRESFSLFDSLLADEATFERFGDLIHYKYAQALFDCGKWERAYRHYLAARRCCSNVPTALTTMTHLGAAQSLNALGRHDEADIEYQFVLAQPEVLGSHSLAKKYRKNPFRPK